ncbi:MAG: dihydroneopterin aldolase [Hyphomonadaceae bacterium]
MDRQTISITEIIAALRLGVSARERSREQSVLVSVDLTLESPPSFAGAPGIEDTVDYDDVIRFVREGLPSQGEIALIETVADRIAAHCLALSPRIVAADVTVKKPSVLAAPGMVSVSLHRTAQRAAR